jgi:predicted HTH domain antitoxin
MKSLTIDIPDTLDMNEFELSVMLAAQLYEKGKLSLGQAAEMAKLSKRAFAELLGKYGVSLFNYPPEDVIQDIANA